MQSAHLQSALSAPSPGTGKSGPEEPLLSSFCSLAGCAHLSLVGFQPYMFWGLLFQVQVLKVGEPSMGFGFLTSQREASHFPFFPN